MVTVSYDKWSWLRGLFFWGERGLAQYSIVAVVVLGAGLEMELFHCWARENETFARSGALATAILAPMFAFHFSQVSRWRTFSQLRRLDHNTRRTIAATTGWRLFKADNQKWREQADRVFKLEDLQKDAEAVDEMLDELEPRLVRIFALLIPVTTLVWGFGDLLFKDNAAC